MRRVLRHVCSGGRIDRLSAAATTHPLFPFSTPFPKRRLSLHSLAFTPFRNLSLSIFPSPSRSLADPPLPSRYSFPVYRSASVLLPRCSPPLSVQPSSPSFSLARVPHHSLLLPLYPIRDFNDLSAFLRVDLLPFRATTSLPPFHSSAGPFSLGFSRPSSLFVFLDYCSCVLVARCSAVPRSYQLRRLRRASGIVAVAVVVVVVTIVVVDPSPDSGSLNS